MKQLRDILIVALLLITFVGFILNIPSLLIFWLLGGKSILDEYGKFIDKILPINRLLKSNLK